MGGKSKRYKLGCLPQGWSSTAGDFNKAYTDTVPKAVREKDPDTGLKLKTPISRTRTKTWMLRDSFNEVFPLHMREYAAKQFNDYYHHKMTTRPEEVPSYVKKHWPKDGVTSAHYDAYICVTAAMGIATQHRIEDYWRMNTRVLSPFIMKIMTRDLYKSMRHMAHFNDAKKKVPRGPNGEHSRRPPRRRRGSRALDVHLRLYLIKTRGT